MGPGPAHSGHCSLSDATVDPELWGHVQGLVDAGDWEKVAREAAVFVEDKLRIWAAVPPSVTGSVNVFKAASAGLTASPCPRRDLRVSSKAGSS
jgi:hypothetical protein